MRIAVTMGDACGVGPELILLAYQRGEINGEFFVVGDYEILDYCNERLSLKAPLKKITEISEIEQGLINVLDMGILKQAGFSPGQISKEAGYAALLYVEKATNFALDGMIDAMVTLPMNKEATRLSDPSFSGHTEFIAGMCGQDNYTMMLASDALTVTHVSTHVSMAEAVVGVKQERVLNVIRLTHQALSRFIQAPRLAVAGLNPHAGENGSFGVEEIEEIAPAVQEAKAEGIIVDGPIAPDTVFFKAYRKQYDGVVCMYHDQGHIPMKLLDFEGGVNITLGLQVIRTSVDHGTAFDIAYQGIASTKSLAQAYTYAQRMVYNTVKKDEG